MGISYGIKAGSRGSVFRFQQRLQFFSRLFIGTDSLFPSLFKIHGQRELLQGLCNFCRAQRIFIQHGEQSVQGIRIHKQLISRFIPDAEGAEPQRASLPLPFGIRKGTRKNRTGSAASVRTFGIIMSGIGFHQDLKTFPRPAGHRKDIVFHELMRLIHPGRPISPESFSVHKQRRFPSRLQVHDNSFPRRSFRQCQTPFKPAVFIGLSPGKTGLHRCKRSLKRFLLCQIFHGGKRLPFQFPQRLIKIIF